MGMQAVATMLFLTLAAGEAAVGRVRALGGTVSVYAEASGELALRVDFYGTKLRDEQLAILKLVPNLRTLILGETGITDKGLVYLRDLKKLRGLNLDYNAV